MLAFFFKYKIGLIEIWVSWYNKLCRKRGQITSNRRHNIHKQNLSTFIDSSFKKNFF